MSRIHVYPNTIADKSPEKSDIISMKPKIIILGAGIMQKPAIERSKALGLETVVLDGDPNALCASLAHRFENIDLKDKEKVLEFAQGLKELQGIMTAGTDFSTTVAFVAERLGLPGVSYEAALNASDKGRMRACFAKAKVPSPRFVVLQADDEATIASADLAPFPLVVKPVDNMGARGCRRVDNREELLEAAAVALKYSRSGSIIVEEYMEGPEFSLDAIVYKGKITITGFADRHIFFPPYFIEMGHTIPSALDEESKKLVSDVFKRGIKALGINNGAAKGDIKLTKEGPMVGEIAARLSGGFMSGWTYPYSSGVDLTRAAIEIAVGLKPIDLKLLWDYTAAERAFISIPGKVRYVLQIENPLLIDTFSRVKWGDRVQFPENNVTKAGNVIGLAPSREKAINIAESSARSVLIRLEAPDPETEAFLTKLTEKFPPNAFAVPQNLLQKLEELPPFTENPEGSGVTVLPFPEFEECALRDYVGRTLSETLDAVRLLSGVQVSVGKTGKRVLGREFWAALIRGGYQGATYIVDKLALIQ